MSRRLLVLNVVLGIVSIALAAGIARTLIVRRAPPAPPAPRAVAAPPPAAAVDSANPGLSGYGVIAARNLFNPGRSDRAVAAAPVAKPILHGVVIDGAKSRAFLEDPAVKRVAGYSVGDMIGGGRIQEIADDKVVIARPEGGLLEVLLQDPSKPRATTVSARPGLQPPAAAVAPGLQPPAAAVAPAPTPSIPTPPQFRRRVPVQGEPGHE